MSSWSLHGTCKHYSGCKVLHCWRCTQRGLQLSHDHTPANGRAASAERKLQVTRIQTPPSELGKSSSRMPQSGKLHLYMLLSELSKVVELGCACTQLRLIAHVPCTTLPFVVHALRVMQRLLE